MDTDEQPAGRTGGLRGIDNETSEIDEMKGREDQDGWDEEDLTAESAEITKGETGEMDLCVLCG